MIGTKGRPNRYLIIAILVLVGFSACQSATMKSDRFPRKQNINEFLELGQIYIHGFDQLEGQRIADKELDQIGEAISKNPGIPKSKVIIKCFYNELGYDVYKEGLQLSGAEQREAAAKNTVFDTLVTKNGYCYDLALILALYLDAFGQKVWVVSDQKSHAFLRIKDKLGIRNIETTAFGKEYTNKYYVDNLLMEEEYIRPQGVNENKLIDAMFLYLSLRIYYAQIKNQDSYFAKLGSQEQEDYIKEFLAKASENGVDASTMSILLGRMAMHYQKKGKIKVMNEMYKRALSLEPVCFVVYKDWADYYFGIDKIAEARQKYSSLKAIFPKWGASYVGLGRCYALEGKPQLALKEFDQAVQIHANNPLPDPLIYRGILFFDLGKFDNAIADYSEAIRLVPLRSYLYTDRGYIFLKAGRADQAKKDFEKALQLNPDDKHIQDLLNDANRILKQNTEVTP